MDAVSSIVWCTSVLLHSVSSGSIADVVPFKLVGGSIVPTAETALSPARPLRMWDWTYVTVKKKGTTCTAHAHYPQSTKENNRARPHIPVLSQEPH